MKAIRENWQFPEEYLKEKREEQQKEEEAREVVLEEKRREIIKEWIEEGKIKGMCNHRTLNI